MTPIVDFRIRPPLPGFRDHFIFASHAKERVAVSDNQKSVLHRGREEALSAQQFSPELMIREMDDAGITHAVIMGRDTGGDAKDRSSNDEIAAFCNASGGRFVGFAGINGADPAQARTEVARAVQLGLRGFAFDNGFLKLHQDDPRLWPTYDAIAETGLPIALTASFLLGPDMSYAHPDRVRIVAKRYPHLPIVVSHACWPWTTLACAVAYENPNVYLLPDCYLNTFAPGTREYVDAANNFMPDRLLYASAYPVRPLGQSLRNFKSLPLSQVAMESALFANAQRLLGWPLAKKVD